MHEMALIIAFVGIIVFAAHLFEALLRRTRIPDVLLLILIGLLIGPLFGIASPTHFGIVGPIFTTITFIMILFEAGMGLNIVTLREKFKETMLLAVSTFVFTLIAVAVASIFLTDLGIIRSLMLGAIVSATSAAVVAPMIKKLNIESGSQTILLLESTVTDAIAIIATVSLIEAAQLGNFNIGILTGKIASSFLLATVLGIISAFLWSILLHRIRTLQYSMFTTAAFVFVVFGIAEWLGYSGAIAALIFGIVLGNIELLRHPLLERYISTSPISLNSAERAFFAELVFLLKTFFFIYIGISLQLANWWLISVGAILTIIIFLIRLPIVRLVINKSTPIADASIIAVMIPKGLAAAVLASIPFQRGLEGGELIQNISYAAIMFSIVLTSILVFLIEKTKFSKFYAWIFAEFKSTCDENNMSA